MTPNPNPIPTWLRTLVVLSTLFALPAALRAQATGIIQGRIFNPVSQEYVRDAQITLDGTNKVTYSEGDGSFQFIEVPAGSASITVNYTGYNTVKETFTVAAGQTAVREIRLTSTAAGAGPGAASCSCRRSPCPPSARATPRPLWRSGAR